MKDIYLLCAAEGDFLHHALRGTDAPGSFMAWLCTQTQIYAMIMPGKRYDIGDIKSYEKVRQIYQGIEK